MIYFRFESVSLIQSNTNNEQQTQTSSSLTIVVISILFFVPIFTLKL